MLNSNEPLIVSFLISGAASRRQRQLFRPKCIAHIRITFDGGSETNFIYENDIFADRLLACESLDEVKAFMNFGTDKLECVEFKDRKLQ